MTEQNTGPAATETDEPTDRGVSPTDPNPSLVEANARYVRERDEAREGLATATERIGRMQRAEIERLAAEHLAVPADFWLSQNSVADYLTEAGDVDAERVAEDAQLLLSERPNLGNRVLAHDPTQGSGNGGTPAKSQPTWGQLLS